MLPPAKQDGLSLMPSILTHAHVYARTRPELPNSALRPVSGMPLPHCSASAAVSGSVYVRDVCEETAGLASSLTQVESKP